MVSSIWISGCGEVESGLCEGEQSDNVACTVDICNPEEMGGGWAHLPDNNLCEMGQSCDPKAGCVSALAGSLSGMATLLGETDFSGITVTLVGTDPAVTATTDAMGAWRVEGVPSGVYTLSFSKPTYVTQTLAGITVVPMSIAGTQAVELSHTTVFGPSTLAYTSANWQSPDKKLAFWAEYTGSYFQVFGGAVDGSTGVKVMSLNSSGFAANKAWVWIENGSVYSRRLDGSQPNRLGFMGPNDTSIQVVATGGEYTAILKTSNAAPPNQSLWLAKTDGTAAPAASAVWTQTDVNVTFNSITLNDTNGILFLSHYVGGTPTPTADTMWRVDLAANSKTVITNGFPANFYGGQSLSPDGTTLYGWAHQYDGSIVWERGFMVSMATGLPNYSPAYASSGTNTKYTDRNANSTNMGWLKDSSGFVFLANQYTLADNSTIGEGTLKVWRKDQTTSTTLVARTAYVPPGGTAAFNTPMLVGTALVFLDNAYLLKAVSVHNTTPTTVTLDPNPLGLARAMWANVDETAAYVVWAEATAINNNTTGKIMSANMPLPLASASTVQLGANVAGGCQTNFEAALPKFTFYMLCNDVHTLSAYARSTTAATGSYTEVRPGSLLGVPGADRAVFSKYDNRVYSAPAMGSTMSLVSNYPWNGSFRLAFGDGIIFYDISTSWTLASAADGSVIDDVMFEGDVSRNLIGAPQYFFDADSKNLLFPTISFGYLDARSGHVGVTEMP